MILTCPKCTTRYFARQMDVEASDQELVCSNCGHVWEQYQREELLDKFIGDDKLNTPDKAYRKIQAQRKFKVRLIASALAWVVVMLVVYAAFSTLRAYKNEVVKTWPKSASFMQLIGLQANRFDLSFVNVATKRYFEDLAPMLEVSGTVKNETASDVRAPFVEILLLDSQNDVLLSWTARLDQDVVKAGDEAFFKTVLTSPPIQAQKTTARFSYKSVPLSNNEAL